MKFVVIDMQGFSVPYFFPKELAIYDGSRMVHFVFKSPTPLSAIEDEDVRTQIKFLEGAVHCLSYDSGHVPYEELDVVFRKYIIENDIDRVYVKGEQKMEFIQKILDDNGARHINVFNVDWRSECPKLIKDYPLCMSHNLVCNFMKCKCSINNCNLLYNWIVSCMP